MISLTLERGKINLSFINGIFITFAFFFICKYVYTIVNYFHFYIMYKGYCILHDPMGTTLATNTASEGLPSCGIEVYIRECGGGAAICFR